MNYKLLFAAFAFLFTACTKQKITTNPETAIEYNVWCGGTANIKTQFTK